MSSRKIRVGILFGGRSAEHEVSLQSAKNIIDAIDASKYEVALIGIHKKGRWHRNEESRFLLATTQSQPPELPGSDENLALVAGKQHGSSVGIHKVKKPQGFEAALHEAFTYDNKLLIEECIDGREIECSVLGNDNPIASLSGEILPRHEFYSYEAKYLDENGAVLEMPAKLPMEISERIPELAIKTFSVLCCEGMARVDFFSGKLAICDRS
jgi:D-alanine-D-alanine ligase-like ATP-grasp enzyme